MHRLVLLLLACLPGGLSAQQVLTQDETLRLAFPPPLTIERRSAFLDNAQLAAARELAGVEIEQRVVTHYVGLRDGIAVGVAYFDAHRVRTLPETLMLVVDSTGRLVRIEVLRFAEPPEYRPPEGWLKQFQGRALGAEPSVRRGIVDMTGATLTSRAVSNAARRVLALHRILRPTEPR